MFFEMAPQGSQRVRRRKAAKLIVSHVLSKAPRGSHQVGRRKAATFVSHLFFMAPQGSHRDVIGTCVYYCCNCSHDELLQAVGETLN